MPSLWKLALIETNKNEIDCLSTCALPAPPSLPGRPRSPDHAHHTILPPIFIQVIRKLQEIFKFCISKKGKNGAWNFSKFIIELVDVCYTMMAKVCRLLLDGKLSSRNEAPRDVSTPRGAAGVATSHANLN